MSAASHYEPPPPELDRASVTDSNTSRNQSLVNSTKTARWIDSTDLVHLAPKHRDTMPSQLPEHSTQKFPIRAATSESKMTSVTAHHAPSFAGDYGTQSLPSVPSGADPAKREPGMTSAASLSLSSALKPRLPMTSAAEQSALDDPQFLSWPIGAIGNSPRGGQGGLLVPPQIDISAGRLVDARPENGGTRNSPRSRLSSASSSPQRHSKLHAGVGGLPHAGQVQMKESSSSRPDNISCIFVNPTMGSNYTPQPPRTAPPPLTLPASSGRLAPPALNIPSTSPRSLLRPHVRGPHTPNSTAISDVVLEVLPVTRAPPHGMSQEHSADTSTRSGWLHAVASSRRHSELMYKATHVKSASMGQVLHRGVLYRQGSVPNVTPRCATPVQVSRHTVGQIQHLRGQALHDYPAVPALYLAQNGSHYASASAPNSARVSSRQNSFSSIPEQAGERGSSRGNQRGARRSYLVATHRRSNPHVETYTLGPESGRKLVKAASFLQRLGWYFKPKRSAFDAPLRSSDDAMVMPLVEGNEGDGGPREVREVAGRAEEFTCGEEPSPTIEGQLATFAVRQSCRRKLGMESSEDGCGGHHNSVTFWSADPSVVSGNSDAAANAAAIANIRRNMPATERRAAGGRRRVDRKLLDSRDIIGLEETVPIQYPKMRAKLQDYRERADVFMELNKTLVIKTKLDGRCLLFSKMELAAISPLFERAFLAVPGEQRSRHALVTDMLKQCRVSILHTLVQTLNSGTLTLSGWNVFDVLKVSQGFHIIEITAACLRFLLRKLNKENSLKVLQEFQDLTEGVPKLLETDLAPDINTLLEHATHLAAEHLTALLQVKRHLDTFRYLNWSFAKRILKCQALAVQHEVHVQRLVEVWTGWEPPAAGATAANPYPLHKVAEVLRPALLRYDDVMHLMLWQPSFYDLLWKEHPSNSDLNAVDEAAKAQLPPDWLTQALLDNLRLLQWQEGVTMKPAEFVSCPFPRLTRPWVIPLGARQPLASRLFQIPGSRQLWYLEYYPAGGVVVLAGGTVVLPADQPKLLLSLRQPQPGCSIHVHFSVQIIRRDYSNLAGPLGTVFTYSTARDCFGFVLPELAMVGLTEQAEKTKVKVMLGVRLLKVVEHEDRTQPKPEVEQHGEQDT